jgi:hypothetical protein
MSTAAAAHLASACNRVPRFEAALAAAGERARVALGAGAPARLRSQRHRSHRNKFDVAASIAPPEPVPGAQWQAGRTPGNERLKVLLNGEPVIGAVVASAGGDFGDGDPRSGWVLVLPEPQLRHDLRPGPGAPTGVGYRIPVLADMRRLYGRVELVPGDRC